MDTYILPQCLLTPLNKKQIHLVQVHFDIFVRLLWRRTTTHVFFACFPSFFPPLVYPLFPRLASSIFYMVYVSCFLCLFSVTFFFPKTNPPVYLGAALHGMSSPLPFNFVVPPPPLMRLLCPQYILEPQFFFLFFQYTLEPYHMGYLSSYQSVVSLISQTYLGLCFLIQNVVHGSCV